MISQSNKNKLRTLWKIYSNVKKAPSLNMVKTKTILGGLNSLVNQFFLTLSSLNTKTLQYILFYM